MSPRSNAAAVSRSDEAAVAAPARTDEEGGRVTGEGGSGRRPHLAGHPRRGPRAHSRHPCRGRGRARGSHARGSDRSRQQRREREVPARGRRRRAHRRRQEAHPRRCRRLRLRAGGGRQDRAGTRRGRGLQPLRRRRRRRARAAGHGRRRDRRPGQGLPQADRQGRPAERRDGGRARQADRGRPVRRGDRQRAASPPQKPPTTWSGSPRTDAARRTTCSRPTCASSSRWPSATPVAACSSST